MNMKTIQSNYVPNLPFQHPYPNCQAFSIFLVPFKTLSSASSSSHFCKTLSVISHLRKSIFFSAFSTLTAVVFSYSLCTPKHHIMSRVRRTELIEPFHRHCPSLFVSETSIFAPRTLGFPFPSFLEEDDLSFAFHHLFSSNPCSLDILDYASDLIRIEDAPSFAAYKRIQRVERLRSELLLRRLSDRVSKLESSFDRLLGAKIKGAKEDRKYTWTSAIKGPDGYGVDRKYKWIAEIKEGKKDSKESKRVGIEKNYKWTAEIKDKDEDGFPIVRTYTFKSTAGDAAEDGDSRKEKGIKKKKGKKAESCPRLVEIEEQEDHGAAVLRQAFGKRGAIQSRKGKKKELSPQDAAIFIQMSFRAYLIRRSKALRALRDLAVAKSKLKEIRLFFNNFSYRRQIDRDSEERQRFSEKIIVLLLTVDAIEGVDLMVRSAKRSMVDELEAMLDVVDPQPIGRTHSMRRRTFDMPSGSLDKELAAEVAEVVQLIDNEEKKASRF